MKNRRIVPTLIYLVLLIAVFSWLSGVFTQSQDQIPYSTVLKLFRNEQVKSFVVDDHVMTMELRSAYNGQTSLTATIADVDRFVREMEPLLQAQTDSGVLEYYHFRPEKEPSAYDLVLPLVLALVHHNRTFAVQKPAERKAVFAMLCLTSFVILQGAGLYATFQMPS